eukprot:Lithocolla_globosa_v1_NODE_1100_length_2870_cov_54.217052.p1 type:complete len:689 gc:universal NODE_1100_length_2870_cov_54.217052:777-2843(+)
MMLLLLYLCLSFADEEPTKLPTSLADNIYTTFDSFPCVRLLDDQHEIGCSTFGKKQTGVAFWVDSEEKILEFLSDSTPKAEYVVVLPSTLFSSDVVNRLEQSENFGGLVLLLDETQVPTKFSTADPCPNCQWGLYQGQEEEKYAWNPHGNGLAWKDFDYPVFGLRKPEDILAISNGAKENELQNYQGILNSLESESLMWAVENSFTCLRRGHCDPVGGHSVWSHSLPLSESEDDTPIIMVTAQLDSSAFFHDLAAGADAGVSGLIALLSAVDALFSSSSESDESSFSSFFKKQVVFALFDAEAWGFTGSKRFVHDLIHFKCETYSKSGKSCEKPLKSSLNFQDLKFSNIESIFELSQVAGLGFTHDEDFQENGVLFGHVDSLSSENTFLLDLLRNESLFLSQQYNSSFFQSTPNNNLRLPPSSTMAFLKQREIPHVVINDFTTQYTNPYYYSSLDNSLLLTPTNLQIMCDLSTILARSILRQASDEGALSREVVESVVANCSLVHELAECLLANFSCPLVANYLGTTSRIQPTHYTGVFRDGLFSALTKFAHDFMKDKTSKPVFCEKKKKRQGGKKRDKETVDEDDCMDNECIEGRCRVSQTHYHDAVSPGFERINGDSYLFEIVDESQPVYTESIWGTLSLRMFKKGSMKDELVAFFIGVSVLLSSLFWVWFIRKKTIKMFSNFLEE